MTKNGKTPLDLLRAWVVERASKSAAEWFDEQLLKLEAAPTEKDFHLSLGYAPRRLGKADLALGSQELTTAAAARAGWDPGDWSVDQAARIAMILATFKGDTQVFRDRLETLFRTADVGELITFYRGLPLYPDAEDCTHARAREGARSGMRPIFEAVAHRNPYPAGAIRRERLESHGAEGSVHRQQLRPIQGLDRARQPAARRACCANMRTSAGRRGGRSAPSSGAASAARRRGRARRSGARSRDGRRQGSVGRPRWRSTACPAPAARAAACPRCRELGDAERRLDGLRWRDSGDCSALKEIAIDVSSTPHTHMISRTTDDYERMAAAGVVACIEPAFWLGQPRTHVGTYIDYLSMICGFERFRAGQFGMRHYCTDRAQQQGGQQRGAGRGCDGNPAALCAEGGRRRHRRDRLRRADGARGQVLPGAAGARQGAGSCR